MRDLDRQLRFRLAKRLASLARELVSSRDIISYKTGGIQLKLVNFLTGLSIPSIQELNNSLSDGGVKDATKVFQRFQDEVRKYAKDDGSSPDNQMMEYVLNRVDKDDDDFGEMFGDDPDEDAVRKSFTRCLDTIHDEWFITKQNRNRDGYRDLWRKLQTCGISFADFKRDFDRLMSADGSQSTMVFDSDVEKSWENLEKELVVSCGDWNIYRVDRYEDMANVAGNTEWCVARKKTGRQHFRKYKPPFYLFSKGRRNPQVLLHVKSTQFKDIRDDAFFADRPSSKGVIEAGRALLSKLGYKGKYDSDFECLDPNREFVLKTPKGDADVDVATDAKTPLEALERYSKSRNSEVRRRVAENPSTSAEVLKILSKDGRADVRLEVARNKNCPVETLEELSRDSYSSVRAWVASNPNATDEILVRLSKENSREVLSHLASNKETPLGILEMIADSGNSETKEKLAKNPSVSEEILGKLVIDRNPKIREIAVASPKMTERLYEKCFRDRNEFVRTALAQNANVPPNVLERLSRDKSSYVREAVARNPKSTTGIIANLAKDDDPAVRNEALANPNFPEEFIRMMAEESNSDIRAMIGRNPKTPSEVLEMLAGTKNDKVLISIAGNPNTPAEILKSLATSEDVEMRGAVAGNPAVNLEFLRKVGSSAFNFSYVDTHLGDFDLRTANYLIRDGRLPIEFVRKVIANTPDFSKRQMRDFIFDNRNHRKFEILKSYASWFSDDELRGIARLLNDEDIEWLADEFIKSRNAPPSTRPRRSASRLERLAGKDNVRSKFPCRLYCQNDSYSSYEFIAFLSYFGGLNATAIRQFEKDFETLKDSLRKGGYAHLNCYGPECDYSMDDQKILYFYGKLGERRDNAILSEAAKAVGAEYFPRRWCGESVDP